MNYQEFSRQLDKIQHEISPVGNSGDGAVGDALNKKLQAFKNLEQLAASLENTNWNDHDRVEAIKALVSVRAAVESQSDLDAVQIKLGRVLADAGGVKEKGDAYSKDGNVSVPQAAPSARVNRIT